VSLTGAIKPLVSGKEPAVIAKENKKDPGMTNTAISIVRVSEKTTKE